VYLCELLLVLNHAVLIKSTRERSERGSGGPPVIGGLSFFPLISDELANARSANSTRRRPALHPRSPAWPPLNVKRGQPSTPHTEHTWTCGPHTHTHFTQHIARFLSNKKYISRRGFHGELYSPSFKQHCIQASAKKRECNKPRQYQSTARKVGAPANEGASPRS